MRAKHGSNCRAVGFMVTRSNKNILLMKHAQITEIKNNYHRYVDKFHDTKLAQKACLPASNGVMVKQKIRGRSVEAIVGQGFMIIVLGVLITGLKYRLLFMVVKLRGEWLSMVSCGVRDFVWDGGKFVG